MDFTLCYLVLNVKLQILYLYFILFYHNVKHVVCYHDIKYKTDFKAATYREQIENAFLMNTVLQMYYQSHIASFMVIFLYVILFSLFRSLC